MSAPRHFMKILSTVVLLMSIGGGMLATDDRSKMTKDELVRQDYERLTGTFRLVSGVVDGKAVPEEQEKRSGD